MTTFGHHSMYQKRPASWFGERWREATPLGNGITGALCFGGTAEENIIFNRYDLWHWGGDPALPDVSSVARDMRVLMDRGDFHASKTMLADALRAQNYQVRLATPFVLSELYIATKYQHSFSDYTRALHMDRGESVVDFAVGGMRTVRRAFLSRKRDLFALSWTAAEALDVEIGLRFFDAGDAAAENKRKEIAPSLVEAVRRNCFLVFQARNDDGLWYGTVVRVITDAHAQPMPTGARVRTENNRRMLILAKSFSSMKDDTAADSICDELADLNVSYDALLSEHESVYRPLYESASVSIHEGPTHPNEALLDEAYDTRMSAELIEKLWRFGRYLFICGTSGQGLPFPLYGLWHGSYAPVWSQHVANQNVQMIYWHAASGGLSSFVRALIDYYFQKIPVFQESARKLYNCRGIYVSTYTSPRNSTPAPPVPVILHFIGVAGWLCRHFYDYYLLTGDQEVFEQKILPFMLEAAAFYEDFAVFDDERRVVLYPSVSPENSPSESNDPPTEPVLGHPLPVTKNPLIELAIMKELLSNLLQIAETRDGLEEKTAVWRALISGIPPYTANEDGAIREWLFTGHRDNYFHRHLSHLYPIFPGCEIVPGSDPGLRRAFERAVDLRELGGQSGWSLAHMSSLYARFGRGEDSLATLDSMAKGVLLPNFFTLHNDYRNMGVTNSFMTNFAPVQLDAIIGAVNAVQEMLLFISPGLTAFLPAIGGRMRTGSAKLHFFGGMASFSWDAERKVFFAEISAKRDFSSTFILPPFCDPDDALWSVPVLPRNNGEYRLSMRSGSVATVSVGKIQSVLR